VERENQFGQATPRPSHDEARPRSYPAPRGTDPAHVVAAFAAACESLGPVISAHLWWADSGSGTLRLLTAQGRFRPVSDPVRVGSETTLGSVAASERASLNREPDVTMDGERRVVWRFALPVSVDGLRGVAAVDLSGDEPERASLNRVASYYRALLAGALATHAARVQARASAEVLDAAGVLFGISDPDRLAEELLARAMEIACADTGSVMLTGGDGLLSIKAARGLPAEVVASTRVRDGEGIAGWVLATEKPLLIEDLVEQARGHRHGVRMALSVPIADDSGVLGVLNVGAKEFRAWPRPSVAEALEGLARVGAASLRSVAGVESSRVAYFDTLRAVARAVEANDPTGPASAERLLAVVSDLATACGLPPSQVQAARVAALVHDVGMSGIGTCAPLWERPLSTVEWGLMKVHPVIAAHALATVPEARDAVPIVLHHHERFDGAGYVDGLAGEEIPLAARVFAAADAFVAMTSARPYREALTVEQAILELTEHAGTQFDPDVVDALTEIAQSRAGWVEVWG